MWYQNSSKHLEAIQPNLPADGNIVRKLRIHRIFTAPDGTESVCLGVLGNESNLKI